MPTKKQPAAGPKGPTFRLAVSHVIAFDVRFTLNDKGTDREFGFRAEADRAPPAGDAETIGDYMTHKAHVRMVAWLDGRCPLEDGAGNAVPAGPEALAALYELLPTTPGVVYGALVRAMQARPA